jgi:hypothetical protein
MKEFFGVSLVAALAILFIAASPRENQKTGMDQQKHMQMMEMMKTMTDDKEMHSRMMMMMDGGMMKHEEMMHHGMHGKSSDSKKPND